MLVGLVAWLSLWSPVVSYGDNLEQTAKEIYGEYMSPFCPGRLISDCPSGAASELKAKILTDLQNGRTREEIESELQATYGDNILAAPKFAGFGAVSWLGPIIFLLLGGFGVWWWAKRARVVVKDMPSLSEEERKLLEREFRR